MGYVSLQEGTPIFGNTQIAKGAISIGQICRSATSCQSHLRAASTWSVGEVQPSRPKGGGRFPAGSKMAYLANG